MSKILSLLLLASIALAHGDHSHDLSDSDDDDMPYAERHMHTEHHIDSFDLESFFQLHDLNMDGFWNEAEIEAVYGLHHHSVKDEVLQPEKKNEGRTRMIVDKVLESLDKNKDGRIGLDEFVAGGKEGLPSFENDRDLGHHYDEESEYFLHHEELYHSTPETQTDEAYNHPEDIEHFRHHAHIEAEEDARELKFEGLNPHANLFSDHVAADPLDEHAHAPGEGPPGDAGAGADQVVLQPGDPVPASPPRLHRADPNAIPQRLQRGEPKKTREDWEKLGKAAPEDPYQLGHGRPRSPEERLRAGVPYKYKFRKGLRADEF